MLEARRRREPLEDEIPASLAARLDREVAARVDAELATRALPAKSGWSGRRSGAGDGRVVAVTSLIFGIPLMGIVEGTSHGSLGGAFAVMGGIALVNLAQALGRHRDR